MNSERLVRSGVVGAAVLAAVGALFTDGDIELTLIMAVAVVAGLVCFDTSMDRRLRAFGPWAALSLAPVLKTVPLVWLQLRSPGALFGERYEHTGSLLFGVCVFAAIVILARPADGLGRSTAGFDTAAIVGSALTGALSGASVAFLVDAGFGSATAGRVLETPTWFVLAGTLAAVVVAGSRASQMSGALTGVLLTATGTVCLLAVTVAGRDVDRGWWALLFAGFAVSAAVSGGDLGRQSERNRRSGAPTVVVVVAGIVAAAAAIAARSDRTAWTPGWALLGMLSLGLFGLALASKPPEKQGAPWLQGDPPDIGLDNDQRARRARARALEALGQRPADLAGDTGSRAITTRPGSSPPGSTASSTPPAESSPSSVDPVSEPRTQTASRLTASPGPDISVPVAPKSDKFGADSTASQARSESESTEPDSESTESVSASTGFESESTGFESESTESVSASTGFESESTGFESESTESVSASTGFESGSTEPVSASTESVSASTGFESESTESVSASTGFESGSTEPVSASTGSESGFGSTVSESTKSTASVADPPAAADPHSGSAVDSTSPAGMTELSDTNLVAQAKAAALVRTAPPVERHSLAPLAQAHHFDPSTGLLSAAGLQHAIVSAFAVPRRAGHVTLLMFTIRDLDQIERLQGRLASAAVTREVAERVNMLLPNGTGARFARTAYAVVLVGDRSNAHETTQWLARVLLQLRAPVEGGSLGDKIDVVAGMAQCYESEDAANFVKRANEGLARAVRLVEPTLVAMP